MNDWKELKKDNIPTDILTGDYEFEYFDEYDGWSKETDFIFDIISSLLEGAEFRYRKKQKPAPTHEEIMTKWWYDNIDAWITVCEYNPNDKTYVTSTGFTVSNIYFSGLESADIPPEAL